MFAVIIECCLLFVKRRYDSMIKFLELRGDLE